MEGSRKSHIKIFFVIAEFALVFSVILYVIPNPISTETTDLSSNHFLAAKKRQEQSRLFTPLQTPTKLPTHSQVSYSLKLLFVRVPWTGSRAIETSPLFSGQRTELDGPYLVGYHMISSAFEDPAFQNYHKFGMVRHPCSRLISFWQYFLKNMGNEKEKEGVTKYFSGITLSSFDKFVDALHTRGTPFLETEFHFQSQVGMIFDEDKRFGLDQLLVFEKWDESFEELGKIIRVDSKMIHSIEKPVMDRYVCKDLYTPVTWSKMRTLYAIDFCVLGYSTDILEEDIVPPLNLTKDVLNIRYEECRIKLQNQTASYDFKVINFTGSSQCTMYTYFQKDPNTKPDKAKENDEILSLWENAWSSAGWRTKILTEEDAKKHPNYEKLRGKFWVFPTVNNKEYEIACFMRYVAMATVGGGWMSDYDVLPLRLPACTEPLNNGAYTVYETYVPSLVSGSSQEFDRVANLMAGIDWKAEPELFADRNRPHVSDMSCQVKLVNDKMIRSMHVVIQPHVLFESPFTCNKTGSRFTFDSVPVGLPRMSWTIHFAHHSIAMLRKGNFSRLGDQSFDLKNITRSDFMKIANSFIRKKCF